MAISVTVNGQLALDAGECALQAARFNLTPPAELGNANSLSNAIGRDPARGWLLLTRAQVLAIGVDATLAVAFSDGVNVVAVPGLVVCREPTCVIPSVESGVSSAAFLVEVADARYLVKNQRFLIPIDKSYNVRAPAYGSAGDETEYQDESLNAGTPWTWDQMAGDLWAPMVAQLGTYPGLPFIPHGTPEGWQFPGGSAWDALCDILERVGCAVRWVATEGRYDIVQVGSADAAADLALQTAAGRLIFTAGYLAASRATIPASVRVQFHRVDQFGGASRTTTRTENWQADPVQYIDVPIGGIEAGTVALVWDDLPAIIDPDGVVVNAVDVVNRASERAQDYLRVITAGEGRMHLTYSGVLGINPGSNIRGVVWRTRPSDNQTDPYSLVTEVVRFRPARMDGMGCCGSTSTRPPSLGPQFPTYPVTDQVIELQSLTPTDGLYDAKIVTSDGTWVAPDVGEDVWGIDLTGEGQYIARLVGYDNGRPLYVFLKPSSGGGGSTIGIWNLGSGSPVSPTVADVYMDVTTGIRADDDGGGPFNITIRNVAASPTQWGVVTDEDQSFAGKKTFTYIRVGTSPAPMDTYNTEFGGVVRITDTEPLLWMYSTANDFTQLRSHHATNYEGVVLQRRRAPIGAESSVYDISMSMGYEGTLLDTPIVGFGSDLGVPAIRLNTFTGQSGTLGDGSTVTGGIITAIGSGSTSLTVGTTPISGGTAGGLMYQDAANKLGSSAKAIVTSGGYLTLVNSEPPDGQMSNGSLTMWGVE